MKASSILLGIALTGASVTTISAALGVSSKKHKLEKQQSKVFRSFNNNFKASEATLNKAYKNTINALDVKAQYEKSQMALAGLNGLKKDFFHNEESFLNFAKFPY